MSNVDVLIVGSGFAGSVLAERFAHAHKNVLVLEKRNHIGGNMYDYTDNQGIRVHQYGPHLFHTNRKEVFDYLSNFTQWYPYEHKVLGLVQGKYVPIPFNLKSIEECFDPQKADHIKNILISTYGMERKVTILELRKNDDPVLQDLADYVFEHVFKHYTMKQWDLTVDELDPSVTNRVPVFVSYDDRYFQDPYQYLPKDGYTSLFEAMLNHPRIKIELNVNAKDRIRLDFNTHQVFFDGQVFTGPVIFTGAIDDFLNEPFGELPYRSEEFELQTHKGFYQAVGTVNYPTPQSQHAFTRITEYKHMMEEKPEMTTIAVEYPYPYVKDAKKGNIPYYPIFTEDNQKKYERYVEAMSDFKNFYLVGRLAEYKYYNMDAVVFHALKVFEHIQAE